MYVVAVFFDIKPERVSSFSKAVLQIARLSLDDEPGCKTFDVSIDPTDAGSFLIYEIYEDEAAFNAHLTSAHFKQFSAQVADWILHKRVLSYELLNGPGQV